MKTDLRKLLDALPVYSIQELQTILKSDKSTFQEKVLAQTSLVELRKQGKI
jgi:hypothetical protein